MTDSQHTRPLRSSGGLSDEPSSSDRVHPDRDCLSSYFIIAILIGLLLPAVQKVREAAARMSCSNNMKQLGLAAHNYESSYGTLPPSLIVNLGAAPGSPGNPGYPYPGIEHSWAVSLLPFIEQGNLAQAYNMNFPFLSSPSLVPGTPDNQSVIKTSVKTFLCPSAPRATGILCTSTFTFGPFKAPFQASPCDYATNSSINQGSITFFGYPSGTVQAQTFSAMRPQFRGAGLGLAGLAPLEPFQIVAITDGTSNTFLICEDAGRPDRWINGKLISSGTQNDGGWGDPNSDYGLDGVTVSASGTSTTSPGNCVINCDNDNETYAFHTAGANHVFADGSVRFVKSSISPQTYAALITAQGGGLTAAETSPSTD